jgi:uncharacterized protein
MNTDTIITTIAIIFVVIIGAIILINSAGVSPQISSTSTVSIPEASNYVVDTTGTLKQETVDKLNTDLKNFDGKAQIAVLVVNSTEPDSIEQYGIRVADAWKVGYAGKDNGAIVILAIEDRNVRIEVGQGLEGIITDADAGRILRNVMVPLLKTGDWDGAILAGVYELKNQLNK